MSIEVRSAASPATVTIRAGSIPTRGVEAGVRPNFMTSRPAKGNSIGINIPKPGDKPAFMNISKAREGNHPLVQMDRPRTDFMTDRASKQVGVRRKSGEPIAQSRVEVKSSKPRSIDVATITKQTEARPLIDIKKPITPVKRETHAFYTPAARAEMTDRVVLQPVERKPVAGEQKQEETRKAVEIQKPQDVRAQAREVQISPARKGMLIEQAPQKKPEMNTGEAIETLRSYAKTPKSERKVTPEIKQAFGKVIEHTHSPLTSAVVSLWQEKEGQQVAGVNPEATTYLKGVVNKTPDLKRNIDSQLGIATIVMANYVAIGYPVIDASRTVLATLDAGLRKTIRKTLETQTEPGFPDNEILEEGDEDPESGDDRENEKEEKSNIETVTFMRAEEINAKRVKELLHLAEQTAEEDEETGVKMVNPKVVAQIWELTAENISPIVKHPGMKQHIDGSWEEIVSDMQTWEKMSMSAYREAVKATVLAKTAVDIGENPYATRDDVQRVLTVPAEYTTFRMNSLNQQVRQAA